MTLINEMKLVRTNIANGKTVYDIEPEILKWAMFQAEAWLKELTEWSPTYQGIDRKAKLFSGLLGQKIFEITLQQFEIPYIPNDPVINWTSTKKYDFRVPHVGTIEVKTRESEPYKTDVLVKCSEWHRSDYLVALKLNDPKPETATIAGYATCQEVEHDFTYCENKKPCLYEPCYLQDLNKLRNANEFLKMLHTRTAPLWKQ